MSRWAWSVLGIWSLCLPVWADQCQLVSKDQALRAVARLNVGQTVYRFCEPCRDIRSRPVKVRSLSAVSGDYEDLWRVLVNGTSYDLAYTYVSSEINGPPVNLAAVVGCKASGVSPVLPNR